MDKTCNTCDQAFTAARSDARFCSPKCRTAAHRQRTGQARKGPPPKRRPLADTVSERFWSIDRTLESLERSLNDDRFPRHRDDLTKYYRRGLVHMAEYIERMEQQLGLDIAAERERMRRESEVWEQRRATKQ